MTTLPGGKALLKDLGALSRPLKRMILLSADAVLIAFALGLAMALKYGSLPHVRIEHLLIYAGTVLFTVYVFARLGLYRAVVRYIGPRALRTVFIGVAASASFLFFFGTLAGRGAINASFVTIYALIAFLWVSASRFTAKWIINRSGEVGELAVIFGTGDPAIRLARTVEPGREIDVVAFIDDKMGQAKAVIDGVPVRHSRDLPQMIEHEGVARILLAIPAASRRVRADIIHRLERFNVKVQTIPNLTEILSGDARVDELREVDVADLLGRDPVPPNFPLLDACIRGKSVMVTGAGGSIGSELCRQILRLGPKRLVLFESSELALYTIERELRRALSEGEVVGVELYPLLGSAHHRRRVADVIRAYDVETLYHAAAYKHVPIVEQNVIEGVHNNVIATWYTAEAALECGVETFVLISTDKAVNPTNVMGATKRLAEMVLQGMQERSHATRFCMVRFGNVLESSGSVVPLFREQIRKGGPVTVTHPDMLRYFMTIPEASQLVLQAGSMGKGGDVFVLDMGKPMRIDELARRMINLSGLTVRDDDDPDGDIEIVYTGLRPAEKLFEELLIGNNVSGTDHPMIMRAMEHSLPWSAMQRLLAHLMATMESGDVSAARNVLIQAVREYAPSTDIADLVWCVNEDVVPAAARHGEFASAEPIADPKVASLSGRRGHGILKAP